MFGYFSSPEDTLTDFREGRREGEGEEEKHRSVASYTCPDRGPT